MLIMTTTRCTMGCKHCFGDHKPDGIAMTLNDFKFAVDEISKVDKYLVLTGGEPLMNLDIINMAEYAWKKGMWQCLTTNGMFLDRVYGAIYELLNRAMWENALWPRFQLQVTHDKRYYPQDIDWTPVKRLEQEFPTCMVVRKLQTMSSLGRAKKNGLKSYGRKAPMCANAILVANQTHNLGETIYGLTKATKLCHFTVMPNLDIMLSECRQIKLANLREPDWIDQVYNRLQWYNAETAGLYCNRCEFDNRDIFRLVKNARMAVGNSDYI